MELYGHKVAFCRKVERFSRQKEEVLQINPDLIVEYVIFFSRSNGRCLDLEVAFTAEVRLCYIRTNLWILIFCSRKWGGRNKEM